MSGTFFKSLVAAAFIGGAMMIPSAAFAGDRYRCGSGGDRYGRVGVNIVTVGGYHGGFQQGGCVRPPVICPPRPPVCAPPVYVPQPPVCAPPVYVPPVCTPRPPVCVPRPCGSGRYSGSLFYSNGSVSVGFGYNGR
jgi:hypothetical protein